MIDPRYIAIEGALKTGDIVLFAGITNFSAPIKWFTTSRWSHMGMVVRLDGFDGPLLWESDRVASAEDVIDGGRRSGVQLVRLSDRIVASPGSVAVRQLNRQLGANELHALHALREEVHGRPYEQNMMEIFRAAWDGPFGRNKVEDLSSIFCSELIAKAYMDMGLLPGIHPSNEYTPGDFAAASNLTLVGDWDLGPERIVRRYRRPTERPPEERPRPEVVAAFKSARKW